MPYFRFQRIIRIALFSESATPYVRLGLRIGKGGSQLAKT